MPFADDADLLFRSSTMEIDERWIDYNGHLNVAYYVVLFDRSVDEAFAAMGIGPDDLRTQDRSLFVAEMHLNYFAELSAGARVRTTARVLDVDRKRIRVYLELFHAEEGFLSATSEQLYLHVDMKERRVIEFAADVLAHLESLREAHVGLPRPEWVGRGVGMTRKPST